MNRISAARRSVQLLFLIAVLAAFAALIGPEVTLWLDGSVTRAQITSVDLVALRLEVTQSVQSLSPSNSVRLVAEKRTFVRFYVNSSGPETQATAVLRATANSQTVELRPINPGGQINIVADPDRAQKDQAFLFELPEGYRSAALSLEATVNPEINGQRGVQETNYNNNAVSQSGITFEVVPPITLVIYSLGYNLEETTYYPPQTDLEQMVDWIRRAWPVSQVNARYYKDFIQTGGQVPECDQVNMFLLAKRTLDLQTPANGIPDNARYYGMVSDLGGFMRGCAAGLPGFASSGPTGVPRSSPTSLLGSWDTDGSFGDWYGAHEVAHNYQRYHAMFCNAKAGDEFPNPDGSISPALSGLTAIFGFDAGTQAIYGADWKDNMTYCRLQWVSNFTYHGLLDAIKNNVRPETFPLNSIEFQREQTPLDRYLILGDISPTSGNPPAKATLEPLFLLSNSQNVTFPKTGNYKIVLKSAAGAELANYPFTPDQVVQEGDVVSNQDAPQGDLMINEMVPAVPAASGIVTRVEVVNPAGQLLGSLTAGPANPQVRITAPTSANPLDDEGNLTVAWTASDPDNDPLTFIIQYSADNGTSWEMVDAYLHDTTVTLDAADLRGGSQARIRILASDGIHTASDTSLTFIVPNHPPSIQIKEPAGDITIGAGQTLALVGEAYDIDGGTLPDSQVQWTSNIGGLLGRHKQISVSNLQAGVHTITFLASDGQGGSVSSSIQVTVLATLPPATSTLFFPRLVNGGNLFTGLAVANTSRSLSKVTFSAYDNSGNLISAASTNPRTVSMAAKSQIANLAFELLGSNLNTSGAWVKATSNAPGLTGFFLALDGDVKTMDGADVSDQTLSNFIIGELQSAEVSLVNTANQVATVNVDLVNNQGATLGTQNLQIPPNGRFGNQVAALFSPAQIAAGGYLSVRSDRGLSSVELFGTSNWLAALNAFDTAGGAKLLYSPQFVFGGGFWKSSITLINLENAATSVTLEWLSDSGIRLGNAVTVNLPARGRQVIADPATFGVSVAAAVVQGYVKISSNNTRINGYVRFGDPTDSQFQTALPFVIQGRREVIYSQVAQDSQYFTGVAIINNNASKTTVTITVFDTAGSEVGGGQVTLAPNARVSKLLTEIIPKLPPLTKGYFRVSADQPVASFAVFGTNLLTVLSAVPPQTLTTP